MSGTDGAQGVRWGLKLPNCGGVLCPPDWARPDTIHAIATHADAAGFDSVWLHDHLVTPAELEHINPDFYEPIVTMAALAAAHPRLSIGVATIILPLRDPVLLAKQLETLAGFYPGRFLIGLGAGRYSSEFESLGLDFFDRRGAVAAEYLSILNALLTRPNVDHAGAMRTLARVTMNPRPENRPPLLYAGNVAAGARRAARLADGWIGASMGPTEFADMVAMVHEVREQEGRSSEPFLVTFSATIVREGGASPRAAESGDLHMHKATISGSAREVADQLAPYVAAGARHFQLSLRSQSLEELRDNIEWFSRDVIPEVRARVRVTT